MLGGQWNDNLIEKMSENISNPNDEMSTVNTSVVRTNKLSQLDRYKIKVSKLESEIKLLKEKTHPHLLHQEVLSDSRWIQPGGVEVKNHLELVPTNVTLTQGISESFLLNDLESKPQVKNNPLVTLKDQSREEQLEEDIKNLKGELKSEVDCNNVLLSQ
jgi:hypothetical protein